jgi:hypothetical protein
MLDPSFNKKIRKIIHKLEYKMYVVILDKKMACTCRDVNDTPNPDCPKCLGTGHRVKVKRITGVMEPDEVSLRLEGQQQAAPSNYYYFDADKVPKEAVAAGNIIVREDEADILQGAKKYRSDSNRVIYYYTEAVPMKSNIKLFLKNFYNLVRVK